MSVVPDPERLAALVRARLDDLGWSLRKVQDHSNGRLTRDTLSRITGGRCGNLDPATKLALHDVLGVPWGALLIPPELPPGAEGLGAAEWAAVLALVQTLIDQRK